VERVVREEGMKAAFEVIVGAAMRYADQANGASVNSN
jgi:hypothetical protein